MLMILICFTAWKYNHCCLRSYWSYLQTSFLVSIYILLETFHSCFTDRTDQSEVGCQVCMVKLLIFVLFLKYQHCIISWSGLANLSLLTACINEVMLMFVHLQMFPFDHKWCESNKHFCVPSFFNSLLVIVLEAFHFDHKTLEEQVRKIQNDESKFLKLPY